MVLDASIALGAKASFCLSIYHIHQHQPPLLRIALSPQPMAGPQSQMLLSPNPQPPYPTPLPLFSFPPFHVPPSTLPTGTLYHSRYPTISILPHNSHHQPCYSSCYRYTTQPSPHSHPHTAIPISSRPINPSAHPPIDLSLSCDLTES